MNIKSTWVNTNIHVTIDHTIHHMIKMPRSKGKYTHLSQEDKELWEDWVYDVKWHKDTRGKTGLRFVYTDDVPVEYRDILGTRIYRDGRETMNVPSQIAAPRIRLNNINSIKKSGAYSIYLRWKDSSSFERDYYILEDPNPYAARNVYATQFKRWTDVLNDPTRPWMVWNKRRQRSKSVVISRRKASLNEERRWSDSMMLADEADMVYHNIVLSRHL
jgi:hypothetical protein